MENINKIDILLDATFHHVGLAVSSIDEKIDKTYDPTQKVTVAFVNMNGITVELVRPDQKDSPARNFIGKGIYHLCYEVKNIQECIKNAEKNGFKCIASPVPAKAFNGKEIAWLISFKYGLIELLQE